MPKKLKTSAKKTWRTSRKTILGGLVFTIAATAYYFTSGYDHDDKTPYSPHRPAHYIIPEISHEYPIIQDTFEKNGIKCITTYNITNTLPIYIKREYPNENRTEYLILRRIDVQPNNITDLYQLIKNSEAHISTFEAQVVKMYKNPLETRYRLWGQSRRMDEDPSYLTLGIWYRKEGENTERLIGKVTMDPSNQSEEAKEKGIPSGVYGSYFVGDPAYTEVRGVGCISFEALVNHLIYKGQIKQYIRLVIDTRNKKSRRIASKLHFKRKEADKVFPKEAWRYSTNIEEAYLYRISVKKWEEKNLKKKQVVEKRAQTK